MTTFFTRPTLPSSEIGAPGIPGPPDVGALPRVCHPDAPASPSRMAHDGRRRLAAGPRGAPASASRLPPEPRRHVLAPTTGTAPALDATTTRPPAHARWPICGQAS